jgi:membrane associated rhomboid family serine protease
MSRSNDLLRSTPPATLAILIICSATFMLQHLLHWELQLFTMCPRLVLYTHEYYRIFSSTLFHANLMHIGMNMLSTSGIGSMLEKHLGTLQLIISILWAILLSGVLYVGIAWTAYVVFSYDQLLYEHAVGFSGIIFHMSVVECHLTPNQSRTLFGIVNLPPYIYPWALLILLQMFMPNLSFLGHLSGILTGTLQSHGVLECILPGDSFLRQMEEWNSLQWLVNVPSFCPTPNTTGSRNSESTGIVGLLKKGGGTVIKFVRDVLETFMVCIFGRGHRRNANIRIFHDGAGPGVVSRPNDVIEEAEDEETELLARLV